ncbi:methyl-accepting chemotaxis protein [Sulfurospirillum arsenophilum]|uniref:methyl-accepting chemotaxis protein n=1 Tax=Sulfurospirillum arsenophilum TaxID=56698 RepID=UPI000693F224|nr:methyl-accepting chemotaxis protein [Sulfurospirillum arsenophilum]
MFLNQVKIKTKGWFLAIGTLCGFMANIILVSFLITGTERLILIAGSVCGMIFFFIFTRVMVVSMTNSIDALSIITLDLAKGSGDLTKRIQINSKDEIADLSENINQFIEKIHVTVETSTQTSTQSAQMAHQFSAISNEVDKRMAEERDFVKQTKDLGDTMKITLEENTLNATQTSQNILNASQTLNTTAQEIKILVANIQQASEVESHTSERLQQLSNDANQVKSVLTVISDIADQTNLLALNAAIEAARAGEHGRGFAVVADEVRNLAERTQKSLTEINATINVIVQNIMDASGQMSENYKFIEQMATNSQEVELKISNTEAVIKEASDASLMASEVSQELSKNTATMIKNIGQIYESSMQNSSDVKNLNTSSHQLLELSETLASKLALFKI